MKWITRERPKIDRIACPWLIARFIDQAAEFVFAPPADVKRLAQELDAIPFDVEGVELSHDGPLCSFDALLAMYQLDDPSLQELAVVVPGVDTPRLQLAAHAAGLLPSSPALASNLTAEPRQPEQALVPHHARYSVCRHRP